MSDLWKRLSAAWENLNSRERMLLSVAGGVLGLCLVVLLIVNPILAVADRAEQRVGAAERELEAMHRLRQKYDEVNGRLAGVEARIQEGRTGNIFTILETLAREAAVKVDSMEPRTSPANEDYKETKVEVALKGVSIVQLVAYLDRIESAEQLLSIKSLRVRTKKEKLLDVTFTVSAFEPV